MYVGAQQGRLVTLKEVAAAYAISVDHLRKVVHRLAQSGMLESRQGRHGGILLGRPAEEIHVGDVVRLMELRDEPVDCKGRDCILLPGCTLRTRLRRALDAFYESLNEATLADIIGQRGMHAQLVSIRPADWRE